MCKNARVPCVPRLVGYIAVDETGLTESGNNNSFGTIDYIKRRIRYLEEQSNSGQLPTPSEAHGNNHSNNGHHQHTTREHTSDTSTVTADKSPDESIMDHAVNEIGYMSLAAMGDQSDQDSSFGGQLSYANFVLAAIALPSENPSCSASRGKKRRNPTFSDPWLDNLSTGEFTLSSHDLTPFVEKFVTQSNLMHPCMDSGRCFESYLMVKAAEQEGDINELKHNAPERIVWAYTTVALGMLLIDTPAVAPALMRQIMKKVCDVVPRLVEHAPNLAIIESLMLLALLGLQTPEAGSTWYFVGLAMSKAVSLGMHRQTSRPFNTAQGSDREKLFWTLYKLERAVAFAFDRPFGIEDADIILNLPEMPHASSMTSIESRIGALHLWAIYHGQMLSDWRNDPNADPQFYLSTFDYWRNTYQGLTEIALETLDEEGAYQYGLLQTHYFRYESQLCLRAIVQLVAVCSKHEHNTPVQARVRELVVHEAPLFVHHLLNSVEKYRTMASLLHAYDVLAASVIYIDALHRPFLIASEGLNPEKDMLGNDVCALRYRLGVKEMKTLAQCIEVLTHIGQRFEPIKEMKGVIWAFLAAVEAKLTTHFAKHVASIDSEAVQQIWDSAVADLRSSWKLCEVEIPCHIGDIISRCLRLDLDTLLP